MITSARFVVGLALLAASCGNKERSEPTPTANADSQYINGDLAPFLAQVEAATVPLAKIQAGDVAQGAALGRQLMTARSYLAGFLVGASKLSPPSAWKASLDSLVAIVTDMAAAVDELQMAADANRAEMFTEAHRKLAATLQRHAEWKTALTNGLAAAKITQAPLPAPPAPTTAPPIDPTPHPCGGPCPCTATSIEKTGDVITACVLTRDYGVSGVHCAAGPVAFDAKTGALATCTSAAMFTPYPPEKPGTAPERVAICGVGPVTKNATGIETCVLDADLLVGSADAPTKIAKTARVHFRDATSLHAAVMPDGKRTCFDATNKVIECKE
jgi:hypothetical protein